MLHDIFHNYNSQEPPCASQALLFPTFHLCIHLTNLPGLVLCAKHYARLRECSEEQANPFPRLEELSLSSREIMSENIN